MARKLFGHKICLTVFLLTSLSCLMFLEPAVSQVTLTTIFILPDGTVSPANVPIQRDGDVYTFTDNVFDPILVQKSNVTLNGDGFKLMGPLTAMDIKSQIILGLGPNATITVQYVIGLDFDKTVSGVTVKNLNISNFSIGIYIRTTYNTIIENSFSNNIVGVLLSGSANNVTKNYIADNRQGLFFGFEQIDHNAGNIPSDITISQNSFIENEVQLTGCVCKVYNFSEARHSWDSGKVGNYWSNYNGTDPDNDGIGDTPYIIDVLNQDQYPLMHSPASPPTTLVPTWLIVLFVVAPIIVVAALVFILKVKKKSQLSPSVSFLTSKQIYLLKVI